ncbi:hypothetical protein AAG906_024662 [Vitis piasezkii]
MEELYKNNLKLKKLAANGATSPHQESNLSSQCDIEMELMPSSNCSVDMFATLRHHSWNDPSNMYIDFDALVNVPGFQQYEETLTTPYEGGNPNNTPYENDMQAFCYSLME